MKTYGSIFQAETEGTICPVKESYYIRDAERVADLLLEGRGGGERHGLLEAACNDLPKLDQREEWVSRKSFGDDVEFEVCFWKRIPFLEKGIYFDEYDVICSSGKVIMN